MSNFEPYPGEERGGGTAVVPVGPVRELLAGRDVPLGPRGDLVTRTLPHRDRRMVGAWCFLDHFGPRDVATGPGMVVPPHPHTGLQTVTWLVTGEVLHRDSLGSRQPIRPGQLNLMTAGRGVAHSEESQARSPLLHGVQLWVALPDATRRVQPAFQHLAELPVLTDGALSVAVLVGELAGHASPARAYSPLVGAQATFAGPVETRLPVRPDFEHAALTLSGEVTVAGVVLAPGSLLYLGHGRSELPLHAERPARLLLIGGEPFEERIVMWWNFIGRSHAEIAAFRTDWERADWERADRERADWAAERAFGAVPGYPGGRLPAPPLPATPLKPRGRVR